MDIFTYVSMDCWFVWDILYHCWTWTLFHRYHSSILYLVTDIFLPSRFSQQQIINDQGSAPNKEMVPCILFFRIKLWWNYPKWVWMASNPMWNNQSLFKKSTQILTILKYSIMKIKRYGVNVRETALQPREKGAWENRGICESSVLHKALYHSL